MTMTVMPLAPAPKDPARGAYNQWLMYLTNTLQPTYLRYYYPERMTADAAAMPRLGRLDRLLAGRIERADQADQDQVLRQMGRTEAAGLEHHLIVLGLAPRGHRLGIAAQAYGRRRDCVKGLADGLAPVADRPHERLRDGVGSGPRDTT